MTLGEYIKKSRFDAKLKAQEVADKIGIDFTVLSRYENNKRVPRIEVLLKLVKYLNMDLNTVMKIYENKED